MTYFLTLLLFIPVLSTLHADPAPEPTLAPTGGVYDEGLIVAYNKKTNLLSAYFEGYSGWNEELKLPRFSCVFYIEGRFNNKNNINIKTWFPGDPDPEAVITGTLNFTNNFKNLTLSLKKEHGGCWNVQHFADSPVDFSQANKKSWGGIRIVKSKKAYFYKHPDINTVRRAYIINGDVLKVTKTKPDWIYAEYQNNNSGRTTRGWIKTEDVFSNIMPVAISISNK